MFSHFTCFFIITDIMVYIVIVLYNIRTFSGQCSDQSSWYRGRVKEIQITQHFFGGLCGFNQMVMWDGGKEDVMHAVRLDIVMEIIQDPPVAPVDSVDRALKITPCGISEDGNILVCVMQVSDHAQPKAEYSQWYEIIPEKGYQRHLREKECQPSEDGGGTHSGLNELRGRKKAGGRVVVISRQERGLSERCGKEVPVVQAHRQNGVTYNVGEPIHALYNFLRGWLPTVVL